MLNNRLAISLLLVSSLTTMTNSIIAPSLPGLAAEFADTPHAEFLVKLILSIPAIFIVAFSPLAGFVVGRVERKSLLVMTLLLFGLAGVAGLALPELQSIIISRVILGIAMVFIMTVVTSVVADHYHGEERGKFLAMQQGAINCGAIAFIVLAGFLANAGHRLPFLVYGVALLIVPLIITGFPRSRAYRQKDNSDTAGPVSNNWLYSLLPSALLVLLIYLAFFAIPLQIPFFLAYIGEPSPAMTGIVLGFAGLSATMTSLGFSRIRAILGGPKVAFIGFMCLSAGHYLLSTATGLYTVIIAVAVAGLSLGLAVPCLMDTALSSVPAYKRSFASALLTGSIYLGQFTSPFVIAPLSQALGYENSFKVFASSIVLLALGAYITVHLATKKSPINSIVNKVIPIDK